MNWTLLYIVASLAIIPIMIYGAISQSSVHSVFNKYSKVYSEHGITAGELARKLLKQAGINNVDVAPIEGRLSDCYDPTHRVVKLSHSTYNVSSMAALGVCAHEIGHAIQHHRRNFMFRLRSFLVPVVNLVSRACLPLILIGSLLSFTFYIPTVGYYIVLASVISYGASMLFYIVTLPLEYDASRKALKLLKETGEFSNSEIHAAKQVLTAAIHTYIAAFMTSLAYFLRFLSYAMIFTRNRD